MENSNSLTITLACIQILFLMLPKSPEQRKHSIFFLLNQYFFYPGEILPLLFFTDPRVMYSEPAKFVAKLRDMKTDDNDLLFKCELGAGHFSKSGR